MATDPLGGFFANLVKNINAFGATQYDGLNWSDTLPLRYETNSAIRLLRHGYELLRAERPLEEYVDVVLAVTSSGVERLLKLSLGHVHLVRREGWPTNLKQHGHGIREMNRRLLRLALKELDGYGVHDRADEIRAEVAGVQADPVIAALFDVLDHYARGGRFHYLDELAKRDGIEKESGPVGGWVLLLIAVHEAHPEVGADGPDEGMNELHELVAAGLRRWWSVVALLAQCRLLGRRAMGFGREIDPEFVLGPSVP